MQLQYYCNYYSVMSFETDMILDAAETILGLVGLDRTVYSNTTVKIAFGVEHQLELRMFSKSL